MKTIYSGLFKDKMFFFLLKYVFRDGFQKIWTNIVEMEKLKVKFFQDIISVERKSDEVLLNIWDSTTSKIENSSCGFLIWSAPMTEFLKYTFFFLWTYKTSIFKGC